jgi:hypothetical protein
MVEEIYESFSGEDTDSPRNWPIIIGGWIVCLLAIATVLWLQPTTSQPLGWWFTNLLILAVVGVLCGILLGVCSLLGTLADRVAAKTCWIIGMPFMLVWIYVSGKVLFSNPELAWYFAWPVAFGAGCISGALFLGTLIYGASKTDARPSMQP